MFYSKFRLHGAVGSGALCSASLLLAVLFPGRHPAVVWATAGLALAALIVAAIVRLRPRAGAVLFVVAGLSGAVFKSASELSQSASLIVWAWVALALGFATAGLVDGVDDPESLTEDGP